MEIGQVPGDVNEDISFQSSNHGYSVGKDGIYRTMNGGQDWEYYSDTSAVYNRTHFKAVVTCVGASCNLGFAAGQDTMNKLGVVFPDTRWR